MKKIFLGILLLTALAVISYLKTERGQESKAESFIEGHAVGVKSAEQGQANVDSLEQELELAQISLTELEMAMCDSLQDRSQLQADLSDSLAKQIESQEALITRLRAQITTNKANANARLAKVTSKPGKASHTSILHHYKLAVAKLPTDLSVYEMQVAVTEVRTETAAQFDITVVRLNQIRDQYKIDY